ncbi:uncharacterized protein LOC122637607 [Vespula pensylvanica]|uniref:uncharacterized protein LOC122637607 n=1 Tax=Vespula pensylvanica TaxID=30213 RepID=UPI001CBA197B|nr:uncharacterized protein LOC122637607 [Vespula pensylvanica]
MSPLNNPPDDPFNRSSMMKKDSFDVRLSYQDNFYGKSYVDDSPKILSPSFKRNSSIQATYVVRFKDESQGVKRNLTRSVAHPTTWPAKGWPLALEPVLRSCKMQEASFETAGHQISTPLLFPNKNSFAMRPNNFYLSR